MNHFTDLTVDTPVIQSAAATAPTHLIRLAEAIALLSALYTGPWSGTTNYTAGQMALDGGSLYIAKVANINLQPSLNGSQWGLAAAGGAAAYLYIAYATDASGTGFTNTFDSSKGYIAVKNSTSPIATPQASDFAGLWKAYAGAAGADGNDGSNGSDGTNGASAYFYIAFASDTSGTGFSLTPNSSLGFVAWLTTNTQIVSPIAANFAGLWLPWKGINGTNGSNGTNGTNGSNGSNGTSSFLYVAYASDSSGTGFSLTPAPGLMWLGVKVSSTVIASPQASDFTGLWLNVQGVAGPSGTVTSFTAGSCRVVAGDGLYLQNSRTTLFHKMTVGDAGAGTPVNVQAEQTGVA
ncbi:MAG TPA: hypothetical protein VH413_16340 [Verrucomicrobiae bacterium]|jgi:hypothetical protein|nr:hypothetical protein [Verrucomicrobiae bacterium]